MGTPGYSRSPFSGLLWRGAHKVQKGSKRVAGVIPATPFSAAHGTVRGRALCDGMPGVYRWLAESRSANGAAGRRRHFAAAPPRAVRGAPRAGCVGHAIRHAGRAATRYIGATPSGGAACSSCRAASPAQIAATPGVETPLEGSGVRGSPPSVEKERQRRSCCWRCAGGDGAVQIGRPRVAGAGARLRRPPEASSSSTLESGRRPPGPDRSNLLLLPELAPPPFRALEPCIQDGTCGYGPDG